MAAHSSAQRRRRADRGRAALERGRAAEDVAAGFLLAQGLQIVERNFRCRMGEIDLLARRESELIVVEVRTRSSERYGGAAASIDGRKQRRIRLTAARLLQTRRDLAQMRVRFDAIVVSDVDGDNPRVQWIKHAF
jgi:putative endonuclease